MRELASSVGSPLVTACDVRADEDLDRVFGEVAETWDGKLDLLVPRSPSPPPRISRAASPTRRATVSMALDISAYSLVAAARAAEPLMTAAAAAQIVTMTYSAVSGPCPTTT